MEDPRKLRAAVRCSGPRGRGRRFPRELQARLQATARALREQGRGVSEVAAALGVSVQTVRRWSAGHVG